MFSEDLNLNLNLDLKKVSSRLNRWAGKRKSRGTIYHDKLFIRARIKIAFDGDQNLVNGCSR